MYKLTNSTSIIRILDSAIIPPDKENIDYINYLKWRSEGNKPHPCDDQVPYAEIAYEQIIRLERENILPRILREDLLNRATELDLLTPGYQKLKKLDDTIKLLRNSL